MGETASTRPPRKTSAFGMGVPLLLTGLAIGWLIGLSYSPVLSIVVGGLLTLISGIVGALSGLPSKEGEDATKATASQQDADKSKERKLPGALSLQRVKPWPLMALVLGIAMGASIGVYARTNDWLGINPDDFVQRWQDIGLSNLELKQRLFNHHYPALSSAQDSLNQVSHVGREYLDPNKGGLFGVTVRQCEMLQDKGGDDLRSELMLVVSDDKLAVVARECGPDVCLEALRSFLCDSSNS